MAHSIAGGGPPQHAQPSLPQLPAHLQSDTHLTGHLASRYHARMPTADLSSHAVISLNTYAGTTAGPNGDEEGSAMAAMKDVAARAWARLGHRSENQAAVFL